VCRILLLQIASVYPLAIIHVLGNVLTNVSLGKVAVSFTHTVKVRTQQQTGCSTLLLLNRLQHRDSTLRRRFAAVLQHEAAACEWQTGRIQDSSVAALYGAAAPAAVRIARQWDLQPQS
jgi:hypothetical protein